VDVSPQLLNPIDRGGDAGQAQRVPDGDTSLRPQPRRPGRRFGARRIDWADDRGDISGVEILFSAVFLIALFLFICQVVVWWHTRNILEQAAAEGARAAAAADASCAAAGPAAVGLAQRMGGSWVSSTNVSCSAGAIVVVVVTADTPMFGMPGSMQVSARATAPAEAGPQVAP
jgi:hypothetical protein